MLLLAHRPETLLIPTYNTRSKVAVRMNLENEVRGNTCCSLNNRADRIKITVVSSAECKVGYFILTFLRQIPQAPKSAPEVVHAFKRGPPIP